MPTNQAGQSKIEPCKGIRSLQTAKLPNAQAGANHMLRLRRISGQFQRQVGLKRRVDLGRTSEVNVPASVFELPPADIFCKL